MEELRYPVGRFSPRAPLTAADRRGFIEEIRRGPAALREALRGLDDAQLDTPYREGGWTLRQVAHHVPDSHLNAYLRFRWVLTEEEPTIKTYDEAAWARLPDVATTPVELSLALLDALHARWVSCLEAIRDGDWARTFRHPELGVLDLDTLLQIYAWHGRHHVAHVTSLRRRMGWG